ncbi:MAG: acyl-CoA thioesterase [Anaerolineae bacterium]|nr:acyl-CoA thioesterase [Anaerolineae bacterium]
MNIELFPRMTASHLVKSIDLNHHGTLFAGRMAEWLVEVGFMTARAALGCQPENIVCARLHGMDFRKSVGSGDTLVLEGRVAYVGTSSVTIYVVAGPFGAPSPLSFTDGLVTFVHVVETRAVPHGLVVEMPVEGEARDLWNRVLTERQIQRQAGQ